jgi:dihydrofolate reductase
VFVLTHHARDPVEMAGGTTFHFVTEGFEVALERAREAAGDMDVDIAGGASAVRQGLAIGAIDDLYLDVTPVLLGSGERMFDGIAPAPLTQVEVTYSPVATHIHYRLDAD